MTKPRILLYDIETAPLLGYVWSLWNNDIGLNQIEKDWHIMSWAAKWLGEKKIMHQDQSKAKDVTDDKDLLDGLRALLSEADVVITHNGKKFDEKKLNARFVINNLTPVSVPKHIDTCQVARGKFGFSSNKLEYLAKILKTKHQKSVHSNFPGFALWTECLKGNKKAWSEMKTYNIQDILVLEDVYNALKAWDNTIDVNWYSDNIDIVCKCGSTEFKKNGHQYTAVGKFKRLKCVKCGHETRGKENLFSKEKRESLRNRG